MATSRVDRHVLISSKENLPIRACSAAVTNTDPKPDLVASPRQMCYLSSVSSETLFNKESRLKAITLNESQKSLWIFSRLQTDYFFPLTTHAALVFQSICMDDKAKSGK